MCNTKGQNPGILTKIDPFVDLNRSSEYIKYPIVESTCNYKGNSGYYGCTKHYATRFNIEGITNPVTLIGVHLLANPSDVTRCAKREASAVVIAGLIKEALQRGDEIIVLGDFNGFFIFCFYFILFIFFF